MTPERWQRIKALFEDALDRPTAERATLVADSTPGDDELRTEVMRLLGQHAAAEQVDFIEAPAALAEAPYEGRKLGAYRLEALIGRGGMGAVYRASREGDVAQRVAVKLMGRWAEGDHARQRFRAERRILARLEHAAIARFIDAGTTPEGQPYLVMEYVEGRPITQHADEQGLNVSARLQLFLKVCAAVQHAHQNLVVHRDLKPSNVLVTAQGQPKLLDFGIAKLLDAEPSLAAPTVTLVRPFTPDYASPEQVRGEPITTASDVYALGVVLYELLTGERPLRVTSLDPDEVARVVCHLAPSAPSAAVAQAVTQVPNQTVTLASGPPRTPRLTRELRGDLDTIVLTALRKEPERRYPSVEALADDVRRYLEGRPIQARADSLSYRAWKFVRRNPAASVVSALLLVSLAAGVAATARQARVAQRERVLAERRFNEVRTLARSVLFEIHDAIQDLPGAVPARQVIVKRSLEYLDRLAKEGGGDTALKRELAEAYQRVGDVQGRPTMPNLGDLTEALASYRKAVALREQVLAASGAAADRRGLAEVVARIGELQGFTGDAAGALASQRRVVAMQEEAVAAEPGDTQARRQLAGLHISLGDACARAGDIETALASRRRSVELYDALWTAGAHDDELLRQRGIAYQKRGNTRGNPAFTNAGDSEGALADLRQAGAIFDELRGRAGGGLSVQVTRLLAVNRSNQADVLAARQDPRAAIASAREALGFFHAMVAADPQNAQAQMDVAISHMKIGELSEQAQDLDGAADGYAEALRQLTALAAADPSNVETRCQLALGHVRHGFVRTAQGEAARGLAEIQQGQAALEGFSRADPKNAERRYDVAYAQWNLGHALVKAADKLAASARRQHLARAASSYEAALVILRALQAEGALSGSDVHEMQEVEQHLEHVRAALR